MQRIALLGLLVVGSSVLAAACGSGGGNTGTGGSGGASTSTTTTSSGAGAATSSGDSSTSSTDSSTSSTTSSTTSGTSSSTSTTSGSGGGGTTDHLVISEICSGPAAAEFIEIYNPGATAVDLTNYYLSDNAAYYGIAAKMPWNPPTSNPGTDFLVQFPAGTMIGSGAVLVIAGSKMFDAHFSKCPDFILDTAPYTCTNGTAKAMLVPTNGGLDPTKQGTLLSDAREMVILFQWDGAAAIVKDVDYVTWGATFDVGATRVDKNGVAGYQPETAAAMQKPAAAPGSGQSIERCVLETGEKTTGGNGLTGHDETSEPLDTNFTVQTTPTPGVKNACL